MKATIFPFSINKEFRIVFQPKDPELFGRRRFAIGGLSLKKYIGEKNANTAITKAFESKTDKVSFRFRKHGRIDFYPK